MRSRLNRMLCRTAETAAEPLSDPLEKTVGATDRAIIERARPYTMTSVERLVAVIDAVRYCHGRGVAGAFAECGVWRGGSMLAMLLTLQDLGVSDRDLHLYDTFEGMTEPTEADTSPFEASASEAFDAARETGEKAYGYYFDPELFGERQVADLLHGTGYPPERIHLVRGPVEETLPAHAPESLAILRLDTDWYESTRHELEHLYHRLVVGGVLIVDDYGHWDGARRAVDEFFAGQDRLLLNRIDYTGRIAVKV